MPGETSNGYRTMLDTDPMADVAQSIRFLAQDCDDKAGITRSGSVDIAVTAAADGTATVTFPVDHFTSAPHVVCTARGDLYFARPGTTTAGSVVIKVIRRSGAVDTQTVTVDWIAHQN